MNVLVTGGCGFIGSNLVQVPARRSGPTGRSSTSTSSRTPATSRTSGARGRPAARLRPRRHRRPRAASSTLLRAARHRARSSTSPPRATSTARILGPGGRSSAPTCSAPQMLLEAARAAGRQALPAGVHRRGVRLARARPAPSPRRSPLAAVQPVLGVEGGVGPPGARLPPHLRSRRRRDALLEQLRALPVPREADSADDRQRARTTSRCRSTATARNVRDWLHVEDHCAALLARARAGRGRRGLQHRRRRRAREPRDRARRILDAARQARVAHPVRRRTARATTAATPSTRRRSSASWAGRRARTLRAGAGRHGALVRATTAPGGSACRAAPTASTTRRSTAAASAEALAMRVARHGRQRPGRAAASVALLRRRATRRGAARGARRAVGGIAYVDCDLARRRRRAPRARAAAPEVIVHRASMTEVDACEKEPETRLSRPTSLAAANVARARPALGAHLVHVSTDYVFDGDRPALRRGRAAQPARRLRPHQAHGRAGGARARAGAGHRSHARWSTAGRRRPAQLRRVAASARCAGGKPVKLFERPVRARPSLARQRRPSMLAELARARARGV